MSTPNELIRWGGREFEFLCLAARVQVGAAQVQRIKVLVDEGLDWAVFLAQLERNYVAPLVQRNLTSMDVGLIPKKVLDTMRVRSMITAWKGALFSTELVRLYQLFESKSIQTINYKGAVTAEQFYGSATLRNFNDLDFLVRRTDVPAIVDLLEAEGYENSLEFTPEQLDHFIAEFKEFDFHRKEIVVEPHWSITGRRYPFEPDYDGFWQRATMMNVKGVEVRVLAPEDALLVLCVVGAKGRWQRLQMVCDVAECIRTCRDIDWAAVIAMASATGTLRILHLGLLLAAELSGAELPEHLDRDVRASSPVRRLARDVVESLAAAPSPRRFLPDAPSIFSPLLFRQRERWRDRMRYLWRTTTTPSIIHMERLPLPKWLFPVYWVFVPLHDYAIVPAWRFATSMVGGRA